jgi:phosphatidyl-myo-inositol alpha-mannosyltransferase
MKICLVSPYEFMHPGGVTEHVGHLSEQLERRGHDVTILAPSSRVNDDHGIPGYIRIGRSVAVRSNGSVARVGLSFHLVRRVRSLLDEQAYDVVHYHEPLVPALPITVLRFHRGANVGTFHAMARRNLGYYYGRPFLKRYFNRLHACIAVSIPARDFVARYFDGDYRIVPNGIDTNRFSPRLAPIPELRTPGVLTVLFVGRLESRKGFPTLLEAFALLRRRRADVRLVVVGDGPMRWGYERQAEALGVNDVQFTGHVSNELLPRYYASADVFCAPATGGESFGIVLLEAMASGVPVAASDIPGFRQVVTPDDDGILLPAKQPEAWADGMGALLDNPSVRHGMGMRGVAKAKLYDWSRVVDSVLDVYHDATRRATAHQVQAGVHSAVSGLG